MRKSKSSDAQITGVLRQVEGGIGLAEVCRDMRSAVRRFTNGDRNAGVWTPR